VGDERLVDLRKDGGRDALVPDVNDRVEMMRERPQVVPLLSG
jgi:hypothetical protein